MAGDSLRERFPGHHLLVSDEHDHDIERLPTGARHAPPYFFVGRFAGGRLAAGCRRDRLPHQAGDALPHLVHLRLQLRVRSHP